MAAFFATSVNLATFGFEEGAGEPLKALATAISVALAALALGQSKVGLSRRLSLKSLFMSCFALLAVLSLIWSFAAAETLTAIFASILAASCVYLLRGLTVQHALECITDAIFAVCLASLVFALVSPDAFVAHHGVTRLQGVFFGPHALAVPATLGLAILASGLLGPRRRLKGTLGAVALTLCIALTFSRQAYLSAALAVMAAIYFRTSGWVRPIFGGALAFGSVAALGWLSLSGSEVTSYASRGEGDDVMTLTGRTYIWDAAMGLIQSKPLTGFGFGAGGAALKAFYEADGGWTTRNSHNSLLQVGLDLGWPGMLLFAGLLVLFFKQVIAGQRSFTVPACLSIVLISAVERGIYGLGTMVSILFLYILFMRKPASGEGQHA